MALDTIRLDYTIEDFRGLPTEAERMLHCLFSYSDAVDESKADTLLPIFEINVYINDCFCWCNSCDLELLAKIMTSRRGVFKPFDVYCGCPECEETVSEIFSENDGEIIRWSPVSREQLGRIFEDMPPRDCRKCKQMSCSFREEGEHLHYCFSAKQFYEAALKFAKSVMAVCNIGEVTLGGALTEDEQQKLIAANGEKWGWSKYDLEDYWYDYRSLRDGAKKLISSMPLVIEKDPVVPAASADDAEDIHHEIKDSAATGMEEDHDISLELPPPQEPPIPDTLYFSPGDVEPDPNDIADADAEIFSVLRTGMSRKTLVDIKYIKYDMFGEEESEERRILPEILVREKGRWYCAGFCMLRQARRTFRLDRIVDCSPTEVFCEPHGIAAEVKQHGLFGDLFD